MTLKRKHQFLLAGISCALAFAIAELGVRLICRADADGNRFFGDLQLKPYRLPVNRARDLVASYQQGLAQAAMLYDPDLGWVPAPGRKGVNPSGFNSTLAEPTKDHPGKLRVAVFGASYTRGWWKELENRLSSRGAEVLDFGVGGYGLDQAYLRWKKQGRDYNPDVVVLGCCLQTIFDNLNMLRLVRHPRTGMPFAKPRFILADDRLELVNAPTPDPTQIARVLSGLNAWQLLAYERFYVPADYVDTLWRSSRFLALAEAKVGSFNSELLRLVSSQRSIPSRFFRPGEEPVELALKLIEAFKADVESRGAKFLFVNLPTSGDLAWFKARGEFSYATLYSAVQQRARVVKVEDGLMEALAGREIDSLFSDGHYDSELQAVVAEAIAGEIGAVLAAPTK